MTGNGDARHAIRVGQAIGEREHRPATDCWCEPRALLRDLASGAAIWVHGLPNAGHDRPESDPMGTHAAPCIAANEGPATEAELSSSRPLDASAVWCSQVGGGGTHTASALRSKTGPSLFARNGEIQSPCLCAATRIYPAGAV